MNLSVKALDRRLAAIWFADIVGYTRLAAEDESAALAAVQRFQEAVHEVVALHQGRIAQFVGDAALVEFASVQGAVAAALALAGTFGSRLEADGRPQVAVRVGVHVGEIATTTEGELLGDDVHLASRIHTTAEPGQVVVSEEVARQFRHRRDVTFEPLGERDLEGVLEPTRVFVARPQGSGFEHPVAAGPRSIAVLPFTNLSPEPANEYFSDGVTEEILTALAQIQGLKVISRTSAMRFKGTTRSLRQIGEELGVATILEGSVRRAAERVRITAQLIDASTDEHLWAANYDRDLEDIFAIQADVAERIAEALKVRLDPHQRGRLTEAPTRNVRAYQHYLLGVHFWNRREREAFLRAATEFEAAIGLDPRYAQAWAGLAAVQAFWAVWGPDEASEMLAKATAAAERALELDPHLGEAYAVLAEIRLREWKWQGADRCFRRAIELSPNNATCHQWYAHYLAAMERFDEAFDEIGRALELDPLSLPVHTESGNVLLYRRRYDEAVARYREALDLDPFFLPARFRLADVYRLMGRGGDGQAEWRKLGIGDGDRPGPSRAAAEPEIHLEAAMSLARDKGAPPVFLASMCAVVGRLDEAFEYLEQAVALRDWTLVSIRVNPLFDSLRSDPRYTSIVSRCGLV